MRYLGLDLGSKTLGLAISDYTNTIATSIKTIYFKDEDYNCLIEPLKEIIKENNVSYLVLGLPKNMDNSLGARANITMDFKKLLEEKIGLEVFLEDERLTSVISNNILISADVSRKKRKKHVDKMAASIILQSFLDKRKD